MWLTQYPQPRPPRETWESRPDLRRDAAGVHGAPRREPGVHGDPLHGCHDRRGVLAAAAADRQVELLRVAGQPAALLAVAAGPGLDRRLRAAQAEPPAGRPQRPGQALGAQEPLAHDRARRADDRLPGRADRLHAPRPGHVHRLVVLAVGGDDGRPLRDVRRRRDRPHPARPVVAGVPRVPRRTAGVRPGAVRRRGLQGPARRPDRRDPRALRAVRAGLDARGAGRDRGDRPGVEVRRRRRPSTRTR